ncbi:MAG: bile acid:sodium symporter family protein [Candidatus Korobacteraceae bacterium]
MAEEGVLIKPLPVLNFFVATVMFTIGLRVSGGELLDTLRNRAVMTRSLVANCVIVPALGLLLVYLFPLTPDVTVGILLLAAIPGTPIALQFTRQAKTRLAFAAAMTFVLSLVSVAMAPLAIEVMPQVATRSQRPILELLASIALYIGLPLGAGLWVARLVPKIAPRLVLPLGILASVVFVFLMWETRLARREAFNTIRGRGTILAMVLLLLSGMLIGWLIGGPDPESRRVMATATSMRSVIVVLYVARYCFPGTDVYMVPIVYLSLMVPTNMLFHLAFTVWQKVKLRRAAPA